ncbi:MAG: ATP-binding protein [Proteobacteria bacterium]|nr:ATP-binding protein [Pseudomonadota bacterium]
MKERAAGNIIISYVKYIVILVIFIVVSNILLYVTYENVKREMLKNLNARQMVHAKQAAKGIEIFFNDHIAMLQYLAKNRHIIDFDETGKRMMREYYSLHSEHISIITRIDSQGRILHSEPYDPKVIHKSVTRIEDFQEVKRTQQIVVSDVFTNRRGFKTIIVHVPVFKKGSFDGSISLLLPSYFLAKRYVEDIRIGQDGYAWVIDKSGIELSCPVPGHVGNSVFDNCRDFPDILAMAEKMIRGEQGVATYRFDRIRGDVVSKITKQAVFMPIRLGNNFWSIVVATPEDEFLGALQGLRNKFMLIAVFLMIGMGFLFYILLRTRILVQEVERRRKTEEALRKSEERYRNIFENAVMGIFQTSPDGHYLSINPTGARMYGYASPEEMKALVTDISHQIYVNPEDRELFKEILDAHGFVQGFEAEHLRKDGSKLWSSMNARAILDNMGTTLYYETTAENITERKHLENQLRQGQKMEAIGTLAGGIAHDFNNILTTIIGYGSLLKMKMGDDNPEKLYVEQILVSSQKAANLTQSLLAFSRKQVIALKPHTLNNILKGMEKLLRRLVTEDIEFHVVLADPDLTIMADVTQIDQVLMNLAANARDAMPKGGRLVIEASGVELDNEFVKIYRFAEPGKYALISVTDTGCGMDEKTREKIFEPFFTTKEVGKGTGLGLSMVYGIVKQHNGYINAYSELNKGTTFQIYLPRIKNGAEEIERAPLDVKGGTETILIAEDNLDIRVLIRKILHSKGYTVIESIDGEDAIKTFMEHKDSVVLLILDVVMPRKNGKEVYEEIRKIKSHIKVLFTSGYTGDVVLEKGIHDEAVDFISKPLSPDELLLKVREVLDR